MLRRDFLRSVAAALGIASVPMLAKARTVEPNLGGWDGPGVDPVRHVAEDQIVITDMERGSYPVTREGRVVGSCTVKNQGNGEYLADIKVLPGEKLSMSLHTTCMASNYGRATLRVV